jgi:hypothetical protein
VFLKYVNDIFDLYGQELERRLYAPSDAEYHIEFEEDRLEVLGDRDEYLTCNVFWIPTETRS